MPIKFIDFIAQKLLLQRYPSIHPLETSVQLFNSKRESNSNLGIPFQIQGWHKLLFFNKLKLGLIFAG